MGSFTMRTQGADARYNSAVAEDSAVASAGPGKLFSAVLFNSGATDKWFHVFDATALPADTTVPVLAQKVLAGNTAAFDFGDGIRFANGIVVACSTTAIELTVDTADESLFCVSYRRWI